MACGLLTPSSVMLLEFVSNNEKVEADLADGTVTVGGSQSDGVYIAGLETAMVSLTVLGSTATVTSKRSVKIGSALFPAQVPRLLLPGESMQLPNEVWVSRPPDLKARESRKNLGTAFVAKELVANDFVAPTTRAAGLTCVAGADAGTHFSVAFTDCTLGRGDDVDIRIRDRAVSRRHARLYRDGKHSVLTPLSSTNGVFINGEKLTAPRRLNDGDLVEVGQTMLRFESSERSPEERTVIGSSAPVPDSPAASEPSVEVNFDTAKPLEPEPAPLVAAVPDLENTTDAPEVTSEKRNFDVFILAGFAALAIGGAFISIFALRG
jgi:pSer/pThr/pTyr-binding forkhead associated (FHA) protein